MSTRSPSDSDPDIPDPRQGDEGTVRHVMVRVEPARPDTPCGHLYDRLYLDRRLPVVPVVNDTGRPVGLVNRDRFMPAFEGRDAARWPATTPILDWLAGPPLVVDEETAIEDLAEQLVDSPTTRLDDGVAVTRGGVYAGVCSATALLRELTRRRRREQHHAASHDEVTGLVNRGLFEDRLAFALASAERSRTRVAMLHLEVDHPALSAAGGERAVADELSRQVAARLSEAVRKGDSVARLATTTFGVLLPSVPHVEGARTVARKLIEVMDAAVDLEGRSLGVAASVGLSVSPEDGSSVVRLMRGAERAAAHARQMREAHVWADPPADADSASVCTYGSLREAISQRQLTLVYQPQVDLATGRVCGVEALVRWPQAGGASVAANEIIAVAESSGLSAPLAEWVLTTACQQMRAWHDAGVLVVRMAVNVSGVQLRQHALPAIVERALRDTGVPPPALELELTHEVVMETGPATAAALDALRALGVRISVDDVGPGPLSVPRLAGLPVDAIKLDRQLVASIDAGAGAARAAEAIIAMAHALGITVIAEGVETIEQLRRLRAQQCDVMQGYYFSRPIEAEALADLVREGRHLAAS